LNEQLKHAEEIAKTFTVAKCNNKPFDEQFSACILFMTFGTAKYTEIISLRSQISTLEVMLRAPQTSRMSFVHQVYATEVPVNKRPLVTFGLWLGLGVFLGLLVTGAMWVVPEVRRQMRV
jgi:hypothetical protein